MRLHIPSKISQLLVNSLQSHCDGLCVVVEGVLRV